MELAHCCEVLKKNAGHPGLKSWFRFLLLTSCVALDKLLNISEPQLPCLCSEDTHT